MKNSTRPIFEKIVEYAQQGNSSFHTPGHKGNARILHELDILKHDLTELPDTLDLFGDDTAVRYAEQLAAEAWGAELSLMSAGGCTLCNQTMLALCLSAGDKVLMARHSHKSAVHTAALLDLQPVWLWDTPQSTPQGVRAALARDCQIKAVYLTSPNYFGDLADIKSIAQICSQFGALLLVDNAHGAHLSAFGMHPLQLGAHMSADSAHKTLPALTGGAFLHINCKSITARQAKKTMSVFASTSPSFLTLASLDIARCWWQGEGGEQYRQTAEIVKSLRNTAAQRGILYDYPGVYDPARLTLTGLPAKWFVQHGCMPEYDDGYRTVFIVTPFNSSSDIEKLEHSVLHAQKTLNPPAMACLKPRIALTPRQALLAKSKTLAVNQAAGHIASQAAAVCPPGIPLLMPGEIIDNACAQILLDAGIGEIDVAIPPGGVENNCFNDC